MNEILKAERLTKTYGKSIAVSEVSLTVRQGEKNLFGTLITMLMIITNL